MRRLSIFLLLLVLTISIIYACSSSNTEAPTGASPHPDGWVLSHGADAKDDLRGCQGCHGFDFKGNGAAVSCFQCHTSGPPFVGAHPASWKADPLQGHQDNFSGVLSDPIGWTTCAVAACHGTNLQGGTSGPSCLNNTASCHTTSTNLGWPNAPHAMPYTSPSLHGAAAKDKTGSGINMGNNCLLCHGRPTNIFDGGFVADPNIMNIANGNCTTCHPDATAHPGNWVETNNATRFHGDSPISNQTLSQSCALCHNTTAAGPGPFASAPSCFSGNFNGVTCHSTGPGGAPHGVPYTDPDLHGTAAKADLTYCQDCHGEAGGAGSNPRFDFATNGMPSGCEGCHAAARAHPTGTDRWTFHLDGAEPTRRTHFASGNVATACALCHNISGSGGAAPTCTSCHSSTTTFRLICTACHGTPPDGVTPDLTGATVVDHLIGVQNDVSSIGLHENCSICHGASDDTTGRLQSKTADYALFNAADNALKQGGDHLDGLIEMNGPTTTGAGFNQNNWGCDLACHANDAPHQLSDSGLTVAFGNYGSGACDTCHGYPPVTGGGSNDLHIGTPVDHSGANITSQHQECNTCHGFSLTNGATDNTGNAGDAYLSSYHRDGKIEMNGISVPDNNQNTEYLDTTFGCARACHANDAAHQLSDSGLQVQLHEYGTGDCNACHDTGVNGAPIITAASTHVDADGPGTSYSAGTCEDCHSGHSGGVKIANNATVGINYTAHGGINLGGPGTVVAAQTTEAEICWGCHDSNGISEWNGAAYNGYAVSSSDWTLASFDAPGNVIPTRPVSAIHSVNAAAADSSVANNVDTGGNINITSLETKADIRCSYCHDVHGTFGGAATDASPYLRGTWLANPYDLERPPESGDTFAGNNWGQRDASDNLVNLPRLLVSASAQTGGFVIDQNNSTPFPTAGENLATSAGLCTLCHGSDVDNLDHYTGSSLWVGSNGHSNSTLGGTGTNAVNLFDASRNTGNGIDAGMHNQLSNMAFNSKWGKSNQPGAKPKDVLPSSNYFFGQKPAKNGYVPPVVTGWYGGTEGGRPQDGDFATWYSATGIGTHGGASARAHDFSCSKCHSPHATGLPALLITNCLDYQAPKFHGSGWSATMESRGGPVTVGPKATDTYARELGAGMCHRNDSKDAGWIRLSPNQ